MNIPLAKVAKEKSHSNNIRNYGIIIEDAITNAIESGSQMAIIKCHINDIPEELKKVLIQYGYKITNIGSKTCVSWRTIESITN